MPDMAEYQWMTGYMYYILLDLSNQAGKVYVIVSDDVCLLNNFESK
jgi:hypothetical protein